MSRTDGATGSRATNTTAGASRILVVDDEPNIVELVSMALRSGVAVETAADGREAIAAVGRFNPHLIVLDVMLPDIEGFEVAGGSARSAPACPSSS